jgi:hypothetical protein
MYERLLGSVISNRDNAVEGKSQQRFGEWTRHGSDFLASGPMCVVLAEWEKTSGQTSI